MPRKAQLAAAMAATRSLPIVPGLPEIATTPDILAAIGAGAWIVFNLSGGKDSSAAMFAVNLCLDLLGHAPPAASGTGRRGEGDLEVGGIPPPSSPRPL